MERIDTQLPLLDAMVNKEGKKGLYGYLLKTNGLRKICLFHIKLPQAMLEKYPIFSCSQNLHDC